MQLRHIDRGLWFSLALGAGACSGDNTPIDTDATTDASSSTGGASNDVTTNDPSDPTTPPTTGPTDPSTTDAPTTDAPTTDPTGATTTDASTTDATTGEALPSCDDGVTNQDETDVDCGGQSCGGCAEGQACLDTPDCAEGSCVANVCTVGACDDGVTNQDETDVDCGGSCPACGLGQGCADNVDCAEGACVEGVCAMVECLVDADCDGMDGECVDATCDLGTFTCTSAPSNDGMDCDDGDLCSLTSTCSDGACVAGDPVDCSALDGACAAGACDPNTGDCVADPINEGMDCDDQNNCTAATTCLAGVCGDPQNPGYVLSEDFSDNQAGWTLDANWAIGAAVAGCGDPGTDHTPTDDNGVAGVVLGGCAPTAPVDANNFFCLTSPPVDTTTMPTVFLNFWRDLYSDYTPYMKNKIEVFDGNTWVIVFETFGSPGVNDAAWTKFSYDVTAQSNAALRARWCYNIGNPGAFSRGSWNVDDVVIGASAECAP